MSIAVLLPARAAFAIPQQSQTPRPPTPKSKSTPAHSPSSWEVDVHGGGALGSQATTGTGALPPAGVTFSSSGFGPSRAVPSWYFGDGAALFNSSFSGLVSIVPLDPVLNSSSVGRRHGGSIGGRVHYGRSGRLGFEAGVDVASGGPQWTDAALAGITASRTSFGSSWSRIWGGPGTVVTSEATIVNGYAMDVTWTGGVTVDVVRRGADTFFATGGIGSMAAVGDAPSVTLQGRYAFSLPNSVGGTLPFDETDVVTLRAAPRRNVFFWRTGAGWKHQLSPRFGMRADLSAAFGHNDLTMQVETAPIVVPSSDPSHATFVFTRSTGAPTGIYFSNIGPAGSSISASNAQSSLRASVQQFSTFNGDHLLARVSLTAGIYMRF